MYRHYLLGDKELTSVDVCSQRSSASSKNFRPGDFTNSDHGVGPIRVGECCICMVLNGFLSSLERRLSAVQLCVVSQAQQFHTGADMATLFFNNIFGNEVATRIMSGILALSLFGNIVVSTFTSSRGED